ncbi:MAG: hypothetical protein MUD02_06220 [Bacteroidales bacterium]|jgi:hypothetical protein|nr:hypothetical protein [Bacteroidales bacterium]MCU0408527.1 hypothetical protein [Bacteroidales bacterium]
MKSLLDKLNYKGKERIALIGAEKKFLKSISGELRGVVIDNEIDQRFPYEFVLVFVSSQAEVEALTPVVLHNLHADGVLWFCYPKKSSKKFKTDIDRDHGWTALNNSGFYGIRMVAIDEDWSALRFRNIKYIKSTSGRYPGK